MSIAVSMDDLTRIVVAIDPAVTAGEDSDFTGMMVVGRGPHQPGTCKLTTPCPAHGYVLADLTCKMAPAQWARRAVDAFDKWQANRIVAEVNNGGDMVGETIRAIRSSVPYEAVRATRGKRIRAEPASSLYEQGRVHHIGVFPELEDQLTSWSPDIPGDSPDRLDALVWGLTALGLINHLGGPVLYSEDELKAEDKRVTIAHLRAAGNIPEPALPGQLYGGDTSTGLNPDQEANGKLAPSPFV